MATIIGTLFPAPAGMEQASELLASGYLREIEALANVALVGLELRLEVKTITIPLAGRKDAS